MAMNRIDSISKYVHRKTSFCGCTGITFSPSRDPKRRNLVYSDDFRLVYDATLDITSRYGTLGQGIIELIHI
eukprot:scaffold31658_cov143-Skeletonema_menzelii.AAC.3